MYARLSVNFCTLIAKTFVLIRHFYCTKIQLLFKPAILSPNKFSFSIFFLINQIA